MLGSLRIGKVNRDQACTARKLKKRSEAAIEKFSIAARHMRLGKRYSSKP
jgi:hypothetical protein